MMHKRKTFGIVWSAVYLLTLVMLGCSSSSNDPPPPNPTLVQTSSGALTGVQTDRAVVYYGIPFAEPPVDALRWKAPQDPAPWSGTLAATERKQVCTQAGMSPTWHASGEIIGGEDCLYLDVYRPNNAQRDLPVYVYLHGGANRFGGASSYDGSILAHDQDIIVVVPQYRLGSLGWLTHPALRAEDPDDSESSSGNFALLDSIKALQWVQDNIDAFGGDPDRVTLGGQSAGASNVAKLLVSELSDGLFHGAVVQSLGGDVITPAAGDVRADTMLTALGYDAATHGADVAAFLRTRTAEQLITAHGTSYSGFADGYVLLDNYVNAIYYNTTSGYFKDVPILLGSNQYEWKNFMPLYGPLYGKAVWGNVYDLFDPAFDPDHEWTFAEIFPTQADIDVYEAMGKYVSLGWKSKSVDEQAKLMTQRGADVFAYFFKWGGPTSASAEYAHVFGAAHSMEIPFFFGYDYDLFRYALDDDNRAGFEALQANMMQYLGNFIRQGDPGTVEGVEWERWSNALEADAPKCMVFDADMTTALIGMDTREVMPADVQTMALTDPRVLGLPEADRLLVLSQLARYPAEYYLNDRGHDLLMSELVFAAPEGVTTTRYTGVNAGAGYRIELPEGWAPGDDLVMYAHGYRGTHTRLTVTMPSRLRPYLLENGFAWAASSYAENGYNVRTGVETTKALLDHFREQHGEPGRVYVTGHSMGGHVAARTITDSDYKADYAGALPMCGVVGGGSELFSYFQDWGLLINYYAGLNYELPLGTAETLNYQGTAFSFTGGRLKEAVMYLSGGQRPIYEAAFADYMARYNAVNSSVTQLSAPSPLVGNTDRVYHLDDDFDNISADEAALRDGIKRWPGPFSDGEDADMMLAVSGQIDVPVLTIHTLGDLFVPFSMPQIWGGRIVDAGKADLYRARAIRAVHHCSFTTEEEQQAFMDLVAWVERSGASPPAGDAIQDRATVAASNFGCQFTSNPASLDPVTAAARSAGDPSYGVDCTP